MKHPHNARPIVFFVGLIVALAALIMLLALAGCDKPKDKPRVFSLGDVSTVTAATSDG